MKVLFVCYANAGRSQMAKALYDYWTDSTDAEGAGTGVAETSPDSKTVGALERASNKRTSASIVMNDKFGVDISDSPRVQLTPELLENYNLVVNIADREQTPDWLRGNNVIWWKVPDAGPVFTDEQVKENFKLIGDKVRRLIELEKSGGSFRELDDDIDKTNSISQDVQPTKYVIVGGVVIDEDKILLVQEAATEFYGQWDLPAGLLDNDESLISGAIREVKEETGLEVTPKSLSMICNSVNPQAMRFFFDMQVVSGEIKFDQSEILDVKWVPLDDVKKLNLRVRLESCFDEIRQRYEAGESYPIDLIRDLAS